MTKALLSAGMVVMLAWPPVALVRCFEVYGALLQGSVPEYFLYVCLVRAAKSKALPMPNAAMCKSEICTERCAPPTLRKSQRSFQGVTLVHFAQ